MLRPSLRLGALILFAALVLLLNPPSRTIAAPLQQGTVRMAPGTVVLGPEIETAVRDALVTGINRQLVPASDYFAASDQRTVANRFLVSVIGLENLGADLRWNLEQNGDWVGVVIVVRDAFNRWTSAVEGTSEFSTLLADLPNDVLSPTAKQNLDPLKRSAVPRAPTSAYRFPWQSGTSMQYGPLGVHTAGFFSGWKAVDLLSDGNTGAGHAPNRLLTAEAGSVSYVCNDGTTVAIRINNLLYAHILYNSKLYVGYTFQNQGDEIGQLKTGSFNNSCGWADQLTDWFHVHWGFPDSGSLPVEDWTLSTSDGQWRRGSETRGIYSWFQAGGVSAPAVSWASPSNGQTITARTFHLQANPSGGSGGINNVSFSAKWSGSWHGVATVSSSPWAYDWDLCNSGVPDGDIELGLEVHDNSGNYYVYSEHATNYHVTKSYNCSQPPPPSSGDWHVEYFSDKNLGSRCYEGWENSTYIFKKWDGESPASGCPSDNFSARFTRQANFSGGDYSFHLEHDDGARLFIDGNNVVNAWWDGGGGHDGARNLSGQHEVKVEYYDQGGFAGIEAWWRGADALPNDPSNDPYQWRADYYGNRDLWGRTAFTQNEGNGFLDHNWGTGNPGYGLPSDKFSARLQRTINVQCGRYRFNVHADDGVRLWVGSTQLLDEWRDQVADFQREIDLSGGDTALKVEYYENGGGAALHVDWQQLSNCTPTAPTLSSPSNGAQFNEGDAINLAWSATGDQYYGEIWGGPGGTLTFGWQSGTSNNIGSQWAGYTYAWHVKAKNSSGESAYSSTWTFTVKPRAPSDLSASAASCSQINLTWTDNSGNEEGYKVYRNGAYLNQVGAGAQGYSDTSASSNTSYTYTIKAYRGSIESDASNAANVTTPTCGPCYTLTTTISPSNGGTVTPNPAPNCTSTQYTAGTNVTLTAVSNTGYAFQSWSSCNSSVGGTCNVIMNSARGVTASFAATSVAISSVAPTAPYCVCRNANIMYDRVLWVTGQNLRATYHLQFLKVATSETSIHFNQEVTWQDAAHASVDLARIKSMLWNDSKLTLQVRITNLTYSPLSSWSSQFTLADNVTTCGAAQPRQSDFLPMIKGR